MLQPLHLHISFGRNNEGLKASPLLTPTLTAWLPLLALMPPDYSHTTPSFLLSPQAAPRSYVISCIPVILQFWHMSFLSFCPVLSLLKPHCSSWLIPQHKPLDLNLSLHSVSSPIMQHRCLPKSPCYSKLPYKHHKVYGENSIRAQHSKTWLVTPLRKKKE